MTNLITYVVDSAELRKDIDRRAKRVRARVSAAVCLQPSDLAEPRTEGAATKEVR